MPKTQGKELTGTLSQESCQALSGFLGESSSLAEGRARALEFFVKFPLPAKEDEAWRRTDLTGLHPEEFSLRVDGADSASGVPPLLAGAFGHEEGLLLQQNGALYRRVPPEWEKKGIVFCPLADARAFHEEKTKNVLGHIVPASLGKFEALNAAFHHAGAFLYVPDGVDAQFVLRLGHGFSFNALQAVVLRTALVLGRGARATVVEEYASAPGAGGRALASTVTEAFLGEGADLTYVNLQRWGAGVTHFHSQRARLSKDSLFTHISAALGGEGGRSNHDAELSGPGATSRHYGLAFGENVQRFTQTAFQDHRSPDTTSDVMLKTAMKDRARSVFVGLVKIHPEAQRSVAYQSCKNLVLSPGAHADTLPTLEILADDVKCGHGAAVGALDDDQRFYLMSRGLDRRTAEHVMVEGFFEDVVQRLPGEPLREMLREALKKKLGVDA